MMLSIHSYKARIMTAHIDPTTMKVQIRSSKLVQFDGFISEDERPRDLEKTRNLFFRWLNPVCLGTTELEDSRNAPERVLRGAPGRFIFKRVRQGPEDSSTDSQSSSSS